MVDPDDPPEVKIAKQQRIIDALIRRAEHGTQVGSSAYALFNSAIALQSQVWAKSKDLEQALHTLGDASTQLETSEEARREMQRNLADAVEAMESGFALFSDGQLQICNQLFRNFLPDLSRRIRLGMTLSSYFEALSASRFVLSEDGTVQPLPQDLFKDSPGQSRLFGIRGDRWFQITQRSTESGNTVVLLTEVTSVIRRSRVEREALIDDQATFLQTAFDHIEFGVATFSAEGMLVQSNARFRSLTGLPVNLVENGTVWPQLLAYFKSQRLLSGMDGEVDYDAWRAQIAGPDDDQWQFRHASGAVLNMSMHVLQDGSRLITVRDTSVENAAKRLLEHRVATRTRDLTDANAKLTAQNTELTRIRQDLTEARDKAEAAVRSKTRFLAAASHDLLQPANAAKLFLSTLQDQVGEGFLKPTLDRLSQSFNTLETQLNALLDISRLDSTGIDFSIVDFPIRQVLAQVEVGTAPLAEQKGVRLRVMPSGFWVRSDPRYLARSVQNLVVNAIQYAPSGRVLLGCRKRGEVLSIEVWDSGMGIAPEDRDRIFEAFTRVNPQTRSEGMGLGLSIVEQACRQLGHPITLHSTPGVGSMFRIDVPIVQSKLAEEPAPVHHTVQSDMDLIIAVVEDDPNVLLATTQKLEQWGASVLAAASTAEALEMVDSIGIAPDVLIVDYQLEGDDDGVTAISALRARTGVHIPAIMITATRSDALHQISRVRDFTILTKPVQLNRLRPLIEWKTRAPIPDKSSG